MQSDCKILWNKCLEIIRDILPEEQFNTWFRPIIPYSFNEKKEKMKRSKLQTVQNFLKYYGSKEEWTEELIGERTEALISLAYNEVWKV